MEQAADDRVAKEVPRNADELLAEGKRCLAAGDVASAVESFQDACSLLVDKFGELAKELAEPYYLYGKALLEIAQTQNAVLGSGIPVPEDKLSSDEEEEAEGHDDKEETGQTSEAQPASAPSADSTSSGLVSEQQAATQTASGVQLDQEGGLGTSGVHEGEGEGGGGGEGVEGGCEDTETGPSGEGKGEKEGGEGEEEEETDLKLAWEVLELARVICEKEDSDEYKLKLSDVYFTLGDVALESDQVDQAVADINSGLQLSELLLEPSDRTLAMAHFNLGLAYSLKKEDSQRSVQEYKNARDILMKRKEKLVRELREKGESEQEILDEINDLDALLPDVEAKITDVENTEFQEENTTSGFGLSAEAETTTIAARKAPIKDISHLIRKRPADSKSVQGNEPKRIRTEELPSQSTPSSTTDSNGTNNTELTSEQ